MRKKMHCLSWDLLSTRLRVFGLLWAWWEARNKANSGEKMPTMRETVYRAESINLDTSMNRQERAPKAPEEKLFWRPPEPDYLKINFDGAFRQECKSGAWGFIIRDHMKDQQ